MIALLGLKPWEDDSVEPHLGPLGLEMAVDDAAALPSPPSAFVADAAVAPGKAKLVARPVERQGGGGQDQDQVDGVLAVAPARAVVLVEAPLAPAGSAPESGAGDEVPSVGATDVEAPPEGTPSPGTAPVSAGGSGPGGPIAAGGPVPETCEGDEYVVTITFLDEATADEEAFVEILLQRFGADGSVDELELEGDLADARSLVLTLNSEGNCVVVEIVSQGDGEGEEEAPEAGEEVAEPVEPPEPASP